MPAARYVPDADQGSDPASSQLGALLSSTALDVRLMTPHSKCSKRWLTSNKPPPSRFSSLISCALLREGVKDVECRAL